MGIHWEVMIPVFLFFIPALIGFFWMWPDASRRGWPGLLWAILTLPFGWITVIVYAVMRAR